MNTPVGHWKMKFFNDDSPNLSQTATQKVCFLANGTWYGTTFPNWHGHWFQKGSNAAGNGDRVRVFGNYAEGVGNDSGELDFVNAKLMTGPWTEWRDVDASNYRLKARVSFEFIGRRCPKPMKAATTRAAARKFEKSEPGKLTAK